MKAIFEVVVGGDVLVTWEPLHGFSSCSLLDDVEEDPMFPALLKEFWNKPLIKFDESHQEFELSFVSCTLFCPSAAREGCGGEAIDVPSGDVRQIFLGTVFFVVVLPVFLWCSDSDGAAFNFGNVSRLELGWCERPRALCFVTKRLQADVFNFVGGRMLSLDLGTGVGVSCGMQGFPSADQCDGLLEIVGGPVGAQRVKLERRFALDDVVMAALLLLDGVNQLVVSDEPRRCCPLSSRQLVDVRFHFRFVPSVVAFAPTAVVCSLGW